MSRRKFISISLLMSRQLLSLPSKIYLQKDWRKSMFKVAVVSAIDREIIPLLLTLQNDPAWVKKTDAVYENQQQRLVLYIGIVGVGKVNSAYRTAEILQAFAPELVVNIGYAGGMAETAQPGDIVIGNDYRQVDFAGLFSNFTPGEIPGARPYVIPEPFTNLLEKNSNRLGFRSHTGRIATGDFFLNDNKKKAEIIATFSPVAFDMESAAIAHVCADKEIAFVAVRTLSDLADDNAQISVKATVDTIEHRPVTVILQALYEYCAKQR
jgi:adenosylhomocysteine nucleosidase